MIHIELSESEAQAVNAAIERQIDQAMTTKHDRAVMPLILLREKILKKGLAARPEDGAPAYAMALIGKMQGVAETHLSDLLEAHEAMRRFGKLPEAAGEFESNLKKALACAKSARKALSGLDQEAKNFKP